MVPVEELPVEKWDFVLEVILKNTFLTKHAQIDFTNGVAIDNAQLGITANSMLPGLLIQILLKTIIKTCRNIPVLSFRRRSSNYRLSS